jgi:hypothetical protein
MKYIILLLSVIFYSFISVSQGSAVKVTNLVFKDSIASNWKFKAIGKLNGTSASFSNWNAGGQNSISWIAMFDAQANYKKNKFRWENGMNLAYGQNKILVNSWAKTDDIISVFSKIGYEIIKSLEIAMLNDFKSQFDLSRDADGNLLSKFMAPGYLIDAFGVEYKPNTHFQIFASPFTSKMTFVNDFSLSQAGAFGVEPNKSLRSEFGAFVKFVYNDEIAKNVIFKGKLEMFSNYLDNPQNIDINLEALFNFKINKWLAASWSFNMIYDDDIDISVLDDTGLEIAKGPRAQIKNVIGLGFSYSFIDK